MTAHNSQHAGRTVPHNQVRNQNHGSQRDNRGRRDPRSFDSSTHHRIGGEDRRYRDGRDEFRFEGYWFTCDFYPSWVFEEDVYVVMGPSDVWFVYQYGNPAFMVQVRLVE